MAGLRLAPHDGGPYAGRFAPSPTGPLHAGSLVAALASWFDARAHDGRWLVRIEDIDPPRCVEGAGHLILQQLASVSLVPDEAPIWQSTRGAAYEAALEQLIGSGWAYPCGCTRRELEAAAGAFRERHTELIYPGTCRPENGGLAGKPARSMRVRASAPAQEKNIIPWIDRRLGPQAQDLATAVGDFVLKRADGYWAYQLAVVVDDEEQGITAIVRGEDLTDNTGRQIHLQRLLGCRTPSYCHTPLVRDGNGEKLSKQHGAAAVDLSDPAAALRMAGRTLGLTLTGQTPADVLANGVAQWRAAVGRPSSSNPLQGP